MMLRAFWRSCQYEHRWENGRVLLTGATGYLGAFILRDLLENTKVCVSFADGNHCSRLRHTVIVSILQIVSCYFRR